MLFRLLLITIFFEQASAGSSISNIISVVVNGLRYDISTAGMWVLPTFLLSLTLLLLRHDAWLTRLRGISASAYVIIAFILFGADIIYFDEYGDQFDNRIFGIVHDDTRAILLTVWKEYHPLLFLASVTPLVILNMYLVRRWLKHTPHFYHHWQPHLRQLPWRVLTGVAIFLFVATMVRGGTLAGQPIRLKHAFVVDDLFLNRTVLNPFSALRYTLKTRLALETGSALKQFLPTGDLRGAIDRVRLQRNEPPYPGNDIDEALSSIAKTYSGKKPQHIFLLLIESHSGWTVMPAYRQLGFSPEISRLAEEGLYFPNFLPASSGTIGSMNALLTGHPDAGLNINYEPTSLKPFPSGIAHLMKRLGYTTRFFYGGFISWQRLDSFSRNQGFDEIYGGGSMSANARTNEWGVDDSALFDFILDKTDADTPSFNFILTTSNHPPYDLPLQKLGFPFERIPVPLQATKAETLKVLGHLWYADQQAGRFVRAAAQRFNNALFAISADHTARLQIRFPGDSVVEQTAVPFILYGPNVLHEYGLRNTAGSHIDIVPTLVDFAADSDFRYSRFGTNMLHKSSPSIGMGWQYLIGENFIATDGQDYGVFTLPDIPAPSQRPTLERAREHYNALRALSWQRIKKGEQLP